MFLDSLIVKNGDEVIREVPFHKGINLIVDYTAPNSKKTDSGNSVGKTTVLRLIDFCLDGNAKNLYNDPEFKDSNVKIKNFLTQRNINITLNLIENIEEPDSKTISILIFP
ncbi:MAG: hypothetical protein ABNH21_16055 [Glaciecola sp.]|jgi:uncharacterized protein YydD (DUF2326 family)